MAGGTDSNTVIDGLKKLFSQASQLMLLPDSSQHMKFIQGLMQGIQQYIAQQGQQAAGIAMKGGQQAAGQPMPGGAPGGAPGGPSGAPGSAQPPGMGPPPPPAGGPEQMGMGGGKPGFNTTDPDELRRMLGATGAMS